MESEKPFLKVETFVVGALLSHIYKLQYLKGQKAENFAEAVAKEIASLLPKFHFVICEDCWDDVFLEKVLIKHTAIIRERPYLVAVFESGRLVCSKKDLKGKTGKVKSSQGAEEEKGDLKTITFVKRPDLDNQSEFNAAFEKLKVSIPNFDGLMDSLKTNLSNATAATLNKDVEVEKTENGVIYTIGPAKKK